MDTTKLLKAIAVIIGAIFVIAGAVVSLTPGEKDDAVFEKANAIAVPILDALDGDEESVTE